MRRRPIKTTPKSPDAKRKIVPGSGSRVGAAVTGFVIVLGLVVDEGPVVTGVVVLPDTEPVPPMTVVIGEETGLVNANPPKVNAAGPAAATGVPALRFGRPAVEEVTTVAGTAGAPNGDDTPNKTFARASLNPTPGIPNANSAKNSPACFDKFSLPFVIQNPPTKLWYAEWVRVYKP